MNVDMLIEKYQLNQSEAQVLYFMEDHKEELKHLGIREVAKQSFVSPATIINMSKKIGFSGYSELLFSYLNSTSPTVETDLVTSTERQQFVQLFQQYQHKRIMVLGSGFSQNLANYFSEYLNLHGFRATANSHLELLRENDEQDTLIIVISNSGDTIRLTELITTATEHHIDIIAFVGERNSKIGCSANLVISTQTYTPQVFHKFYPNLFFGTALNQFEILMNDTLKFLSH